MPYPNSQHPDQYGWPAHGVGPYEDFSFGGYKFPSGVAVGTGPIWTRVGELITANGTRLADNVAPPLTQDKVSSWNFWGQEDRQSRNSGNWSIHSWGLATDWNSAFNPNRSDSPPAGPFRLPSNFQQILDAEFGEGALLFGGGWGDWMHVEIHMTPAEVARWISNHLGATSPGTTDQPTPPEDTNDMADITPAQMDQIAQKVADKLTAAWLGPLLEQTHVTDNLGIIATTVEGLSNGQGIQNDDLNAIRVKLGVGK